MKLTILYLLSINDANAVVVIKMNIFLNKINLHRPEKLSDPIQEQGQSTIDEILTKNDDEPNGIDFNILLNGQLPSGTYNEVKYFLPLSYDYLTNILIDRLEMICNWVDFIFKNESAIEEDFSVKSEVTYLMI